METDKLKKKLINRLKSLEDLEDVSVRASGPEKSGVSVKHTKFHALDFKFVWSKDHYIGYFMDDTGKTSQAVFSLWEPMDAINFATAYALLVNMRAKQRS